MLQARELEDGGTRQSGCDRIISPTSSTKHISSRELPHARHELCKTATEYGHADDGIGGHNLARASIKQRKYQCCRREREEPAETRING